MKAINNLNISLKRTYILIFLTILVTSKEIPRNEIIHKETGHKNVVLGNAFYTYVEVISSFLSYKFFLKLEFIFEKSKNQKPKYTFNLFSIAVQVCKGEVYHTSFSNKAIY